MNTVTNMCCNPLLYPNKWADIKSILMQTLALLNVLADLMLVFSVSCLYFVFPVVCQLILGAQGDRVYARPKLYRINDTLSFFTSYLLPRRLPTN